VFLDRDGVLIHDVGYPRDPERVRLLDGAAAALARLRQWGFALVVVSNQSGVGRGLVTAGEARRVHDRMTADLAAQGVALDAAYYCFHAPEDGCECRKPSPGMLLQAARELNLDPARSFLVGDKAIDVEAGRRAGCRTIVLTGPASVGIEESRPCAVAASWPEVVEAVKALRKQYG